MFIIHFIIRSMIAIDAGMFWISKKVCRFVQEWTGITSFTLARTCSLLLFLGSMSIMALVFFGDMTSWQRFWLSLAVIIGLYGSCKSLGLVDYVQKCESVYAMNPFRYSTLDLMVRIYTLLLACVVSLLDARQAAPGVEMTRSFRVCDDILHVEAWIVVFFLYLVATNPDPLGPSRIDRAMRRLFPRSA